MSAHKYHTESLAYARYIFLTIVIFAFKVLASGYSVCIRAPISNVPRLQFT